MDYFAHLRTAHEVNITCQVVNVTTFTYPGRGAIQSSLVRCTQISIDLAHG